MNIYRFQQNNFALVLLVISAFLLQTCGKDDPEEPKFISIETYVEQNNLTLQFTASDIGYVIANPGNQRMANAESTVTIDVIVKTTDNNVVIDTEGDIYLNLAGQVAALHEGIQLVGEGGRILLYVPYEQAWGASGNENVPPMADVIMEITVTKVLFTIEEYISEHNITTTTTFPSGVQVLIEEEGDGNFPNIASVVSTSYKGYFTDGFEFDNSNGEALEFSLGTVIPGWSEGLQAFDKGAKGKLFIPYEWAYGNRGYQTIPGKTDLIFDIELVDIN